MNKMNMVNPNIIMIKIVTIVIINVIIKRVGSTFQTVRETRIPDRQLFLSNFVREAWEASQPIKELAVIKLKTLNPLKMEEKGEEMYHIGGLQLGRKGEKRDNYKEARIKTTGQNILTI